MRKKCIGRKKGLRTKGYVALRKPSVRLTGKRLQFVLFQSDENSQRKKTGGCSDEPILPNDSCSNLGLFQLVRLRFSNITRSLDNVIIG